MASFPRPYINTVPSEPGQDAMIKTVDYPKMGIGANSAGMPSKSVNSSEMGLEHVGGNKARG